MVDQHPHGGHDIVLDPNNANVGTVRGRGMVERSLSQYGAGRSILISADDVALAGNKTLETARELGIPVKVIESDGTTLYAIKRTDLPYDDPRARELAIADNRSAETGLSWSAEVLTALQDEGLDIEQFWFPDELAELLAMSDDGTDGLTDPDDVPAVPDEPITKPGDLWLMGEHRLLCGDSTVVTDVDRLMAGRKADMVWTDPPYGVSYVGKTKDALVIQNDSMPDDEFEAWLRDVFSLMATVMQPGCPYYVCCPAGNKHRLFWNSLQDVGLPVRQGLVWLKQSMVLGHSDYHYKHEPMLYGWAEGAHYFTDDRTQVSVWDIDRPSRSADHPTSKPVALVEKAILNSSRAGAIVYEPFGGSGSTLIAAEQTNRTAYLMEIDPKYCDVIVQRYETHTGQTASREQVEG